MTPTIRVQWLGLLAKLVTPGDPAKAFAAMEAFLPFLAEVPDAWLEPVPGAETPEQLRSAYVAFLTARLESRQWLPSGPVPGAAEVAAR